MGLSIKYIIMNNILLTLSAKMLDLASDEFSNHGCNDLDDKLVNSMSDSEKEDLLKGMQEWHDDDSYPSCIEQVGDSFLMEYLSYKLKEEAIVEQRNYDDIINSFTADEIDNSLDSYKRKELYEILRNEFELPIGG